MTDYWHGFFDAALLIPLVGWYVFFVRSLWRGAVGRLPVNWLERWLAS